MQKSPVTIKSSQARQIWLNATLINENLTHNKSRKEFESTQKIIEHLGYVQIDTIFVIERCHHHILFSRSPSYRREDLYHCQTKSKSVFEYWTHALSYIPTKDLSYYLRKMSDFYKNHRVWYDSVKRTDLTKILKKIKNEGPVTLRDMDDDVTGLKNDWWTSKKPSKKVLQYGFYGGKLAVSERIGMLKKFELFDRHFDFAKDLQPKTETDRLNYLLDSSLRSQGLVSLESICHLNNPDKKAIQQLIDRRAKKNLLVPALLQNNDKWLHWVEPQLLDEKPVEIGDQTAYLLSPFDPLTIQRKRLHAFFDYNHIFEAYVPLKKRKFGYFTLPVLIGDRIVAGLDLKTDRQSNKLLVQNWHWFQKKNNSDKKKIETALHSFEKFQLDWKN